MHDKIAALSLTDADRDPTGFADKLGRSFGDTGFAIIADHGIAQALIDRAEAQARAFFALPEEVKRRYAIAGTGGARGYTSSALRFNQSRAVALDMESATVAAQGYRFRVPYGTLLCVSDKPLHGELKLPGQANDFYERAIGQHLRIGIETLDLLRQEGDGLHSRKLRSFDEPPLR